MYHGEALCTAFVQSVTVCVDLCFSLHWRHMHGKWEPP